MYEDLLQLRKKTTIMNQYNQVSHLIQDTKLESDINARKHHIKESQEVSCLLAGSHMAAITNKKSNNFGKFCIVSAFIVHHIQYQESGRREYVFLHTRLGFQLFLPM